MAATASSSELRLRRVCATAASETMNLMVAVLAVVAAVALGSWPVLIGGLGVYAALVVSDLVRPSFWQRAIEAEQQRLPELPAPADLSHSALQDAVLVIAGSRGALHRAVNQAPKDMRGSLEGALASRKELEACALRLIWRVEDLTRWLKTVDLDGLKSEIRRLGERCRNATAEQAQRRYREAMDAREEQLRIVQQITDNRDQCLATLSCVLATLDALPFRLARMRVVDDQLTDDVAAAAEVQLRRMRAEVASLEQTIDALVEVTPPPQVSDVA